MLAQRLILGASGLLGREIFRVVNKNHRYLFNGEASVLQIQRLNRRYRSSSGGFGARFAGFVLMGVTEIDKCARAPIASML